MAYRQRLDKKFKDFQRALDKILELSHKDLEKEILYEVTAKRLEYTFEILWKLTKLLLEAKGLLCYSPLECFKALYQEGLIDEKLYKNLVHLTRMRNTIVHVYDFSTAEYIYIYTIKELKELLVNIREVLAREINKLIDM